MRIYHLFIGCAIALLLQSCDKNDPFPDVEDEHVRKKVEVFLEGNQDEIYPWVRFSANTYKDRPLYVVQGNDTTACADGSFDLGRGEFPKSGRLVLCVEGTKHDMTLCMSWLHTGKGKRRSPRRIGAVDGKDKGLRRRCAGA